MCTEVSGVEKNWSVRQIKPAQLALGAHFNIVLLTYLLTYLES